MTNHTFNIEWKGRGFQSWHVVLMIHEDSGASRASFKQDLEAFSEEAAEIILKWAQVLPRYNGLYDHSGRRVLGKMPLAPRVEKQFNYLEYSIEGVSMGIDVRGSFKVFCEEQLEELYKQQFGDMVGR